MIAPVVDDARRDTTPLRLTTAELAFIGAAVDSPQAAVSLSKLGLKDEAGDANLQAVGASELIARELARLTGDRIELIAGAGLTAAVMGRMQAWGQIGFSAADIANALVVFVADEQVTVLVDPRPMGVFEFRLLRPGTPLADVTAPLVANFLDLGPNRMVVTRSGAGDSDRSAAVMRGVGGNWQLATGIPNPAADVELQPEDFRQVERAEALEMLFAALSFVAPESSSES
jgi:hypothetical protein